MSSRFGLQRQIQLCLYIIYLQLLTKAIKRRQNENQLQYIPGEEPKTLHQKYISVSQLQSCNHSVGNWCYQILVMDDILQRPTRPQLHEAFFFLLAAMKRKPNSIKHPAKPSIDLHCNIIQKSIYVLTRALSNPDICCLQRLISISRALIRNSTGTLLC